MPPGSRFEPKRFIDRDDEQQLFENVLDTGSSHRMIAISGEPGAGKSELLLRYRHRCRTSLPRIPVSFVELKPALDRLALVERIARELKTPLPRFQQLRIAWRSGEFEPFRQWINLENASFEGAHDFKVANTLVEYAREVTVVTPDGKLTEGQDAMARELCIHAFFDDLVKMARQQSVVLILDAYEKVSDERDEDEHEGPVLSWLHGELLERLFDEPDPLNLVVVLAGRVMPNFEANWAAESIAARVELREKLGEWTREHVEQCLKAHGFRHRPADVDTFCQAVNMGATPQLLIQLMQTNHNTLEQLGVP
jgi:hypothetical protein